MPNQPKTPARTVRVDDELWEAFKNAAERKGLSASAVLIRYMRHYVRQGSAGRLSETG